MAESTRLLLPSLDEYLGPADKRFFGAGYRRPRHSLSAVSVTAHPDGTGVISGVAAVEYPKDWSRKGTADQPPHLSTVDVIVLGERLAALYLQAAFGVSAGDPRVEALGTIRISAGSSPVEEELAGFRVEARAASTMDLGTPSVVCTTFDCAIANLRLVVSLRHPPGERRDTTAPVPDVTGPPSGRRPFATGWAERANTASDVVVDRDTLTASARARFGPAPSGPVRPQDLVVDAFVVTLQLGQILLYELDRFDRADSNTLWMRQTEIRWPTRPRDVAGLPAATTRLVRPRLLDRGTGRWRVADIRGDVYGVAVHCAIAHLVP
ncbi:AvrD family protein [Amycolatopsis australiensis]|uniref:Avirulence D protein (AvrD) n=1 Tax=Amycolatopsis australiensis TaxID=546364 RepID=A0A1K1S3M1_9PSEU|nr:AvrD family protein [Amycolatopsis australiensis]SFW78684.1 avirulence D protein (AvrD) [Amycolatopsis australiensis]